jgi:glutathione synthase/RimK-type ligase-like ATP-grasp enzyme
MILLWGLTGDGPFDRVRAVLETRAAEIALIDQRDVFRTEFEMTVDPVLNATVSVAGQRVDLADASAAYWRTHDLRTLLVTKPRETDGTGGYREQRALALEQGLLAWLEMVDARVINRPSSMASNNSKPYQAAILREHGFDVPETIITTDPQEVLRFWTDHATVIYKSISGTRSIVSRLTRSHIEQLERVVWCPTQFQQYVPGRDVRVHVVEDDIFACEVRSEADDYRYARGSDGSVEIRDCQLPHDVADRCVAVTRALGLHLSGIDLRQAPDGRWFAFEANPSPGFTYYEDHTGQPIAAAVASLLASAHRLSPSNPP